MKTILVGGISYTFKKHGSIDSIFDRNVTKKLYMNLLDLSVLNESGIKLAETKVDYIYLSDSNGHTLYYPRYNVYQPHKSVKEKMKNIVEINGIFKDSDVFKVFEGYNIELLIINGVLRCKIPSLRATNVVAIDFSVFDLADEFKYIKKLCETQLFLLTSGSKVTEAYEYIDCNIASYHLLLPQKLIIGIPINIGNFLEISKQLNLNWKFPFPELKSVIENISISKYLIDSHISRLLLERTQIIRGNVKVYLTKKDDKDEKIINLKDYSNYKKVTIFNADGHELIMDCELPKLTKLVIHGKINIHPKTFKFVNSIHAIKFETMEGLILEKNYSKKNKIIKQQILKDH